MSTENNEASKEQTNEPKLIEESLNISESKPRISEDIKKLLNSLLHKTLDKRLKRLENRHIDQKKYAELAGKSFKLYKSQLEFLKKNMEETLKKKEAKKKEETPRRLKANSKRPLSSKSVPQNKRSKSRISRLENNNESKILEKKKLNLTGYKTENNSKEKQNRAKSFREKRMLSESNLKKGKTKVKKIDNSSLIINKDEKKEDLKAKTMTNYHSEKKNEGKRNANNLLKSKTRDKDKKLKNNNELSKSLFEITSEKTKKNKEKLFKSEKKDKKLSTSHMSIKENLKDDKKGKIEKKTEKESKKKELSKKQLSKKELLKKERKKEDKKEGKKEEAKEEKKEEKKEEMKEEKKEEIKKEEKKEEKIEKEPIKEEEKVKNEEKISEKKNEASLNHHKEEESQKPNDLKQENYNLISDKGEIKPSEAKGEEIILENKENKILEEIKKEDNKNDNIVEGNNDKLIEEFKKEYIEKVKEEMDNNYELHNITMNPILNQSLNASMSFSQSFLLSKSMVDEPMPKLPPRDPNKPLTLDEIIKDYKNAFIYVLDFLTLNEKIAFTGVHRGFKAERAYLFNMKREEVISSLELKDKETIEERINKLKSKYGDNISELTKPFAEFSPSKASSKTVVLLNNDLYSKLFKIPVLDDNLNDIYIIYRLLFVLFGEHEIADTMDDRLFWIRCTEYLITKSNGKIGTFILEKSKNFNFSHQSIYLMNRLLVGIKPKFIPNTFTKVSGTTGLLFFLIKDCLEYCGVLINDKKTQPSRIYDNLNYYKNIIDSLANFVDFLSKLKIAKK